MQLRTSDSLAWRTAPGTRVTVPIPYPRGASRAALTVTGRRFAAFYPNAFGLYSLIGNCYEWTLNAWGWSTDTAGYTRENPCVEPVGTNSRYRVVRGQPYSYQFKGTSIALRSGIEYGSYGSCTGFRLWFVAE